MTAVGQGRATITAAVDGKSAQCAVKVSNGLQSFDFTKASTGEDVKAVWDVIRENPEKWSIGEEGLTILTEKGDLYTSTNTAKNMFYQEASGDWYVETAVELDQVPAASYQQAAMIVYEDDDNYMKLGYQGNNGITKVEINSEENGSFGNASASVDFTGTRIWFRLMKEGNTYTAWYSADGETYTELGTKTIELQNIKLILTANNGTGNAGEVKAEFKYFKLLETETPVAGVSLDHSKLTLKTGSSEKLTATVAPDNATNKAVTWTTSNAAVAEVDSEGKVTAKAAGTATITVTTEDGGYTAVCEVTVERVSSGSSSGGGSSAASYTITVKQGAGGTISPATSTVNKDASKTFTITANEGYKIADVLVDGKSVGAVSTYTFDKVGANHTITAVFEKAKSGLPFTDVTGHWAKDAIEYAYENKLFAGSRIPPLAPTLR